MKIEKKIQLLTAQAFDRKSASIHEEDKVVLQFYGRDESNELIKVEWNQFRPYYFIDHPEYLPTSSINLAFNDLENKPVYKVEFNSLENHRNSAKKYRKTYESDILPVERFLMDKKIFGSMKAVGNWQENNSGEKIFIASSIEPDLLNAEFSLFSFDIETSKKNEVISLAYSYQFAGTKVEKTWVLYKEKFHAKFNDAKDFEWVRSEKELIEKFIVDVTRLDPDFILGWNVIGFDLNFLAKKCNELNISFSIGRDNKELRLFEGLRNELRAKLPGRVILDGPRTLKTNFYQYESYKLNNVAKIVLGDTKDIDEDDVDDKWGEIERRYYNDPLSLAIYNLKDAVLVIDIFKKLELIELLKRRVLISGLLFDRIGGSTAAFDHYYLPFIHENGHVAPNVLDVEGIGSADGGYVLEPQVGIHDYVVVLDFKSLYPTVISTFKIDPYSRLKKDIHPKNTPVGISFSSTEYFLPSLIDKLLQKRAEAKKIKDPYLSQSIKILMNSFYGVMGSYGCRFYHKELPQAITGTGQWVLKTTIQWIENKGFVVLYGDTDSIFVKLPNFKDVNIDQLVLEINTYLKDLIAEKYQHESKLEIQFDKKFRRLFLSPIRGGQSGAKKKYAGLLLKDNGEEELLITGMEFVRSDWSKVARKFQYELLRLFLNGENLDNYIKNFVKDLRLGLFHEDLGMKKRLSRSTEDYSKMTPPHVHAARLLEKERGIKVSQVEFVITKRGAIPIQLPHDDIDYEYYLEKQIKPLADGVLIFQGKSFDQLIQGEQLSLF